MLIFINQLVKTKIVGRGYMGKIIAFSNQKGGVGKTTTAINLATYIALAGRKVLLLDFDPQGNTTSGFGTDKSALTHSSYDVIAGNCSAYEAIIPTMIPKLSLLPSHIDLAGAEVELVPVPDREIVLRKAIAPIKNNFDYIIIDCPPSLGLLTLNALTCADAVAIPIQSEFFALEGLSQLMHTIKLVKERLNNQLEICGVIFTMYDSRSIISRQVTQEISKFFGKKVFTTVVPRNVKLTEAPSYGVPINLHAPKSSGAIAYEALAYEFLQRLEQNR